MRALGWAHPRLDVVGLYVGPPRIDHCTCLCRHGVPSGATVALRRPGGHFLGGG